MTVVLLDRPLPLTVCDDEVLQACENSLQLTSVDTLHLKLLPCLAFQRTANPNTQCKSPHFFETGSNLASVFCGLLIDAIIYRLLGNRAYLLSCRELNEEIIPLSYLSVKYEAEARRWLA